MTTISRRLDDGVTDIQTWVHWHDGKMTVENIQDVEPTLEHNKEAQKYYQENAQKGPIREVAEIPILVQYKWLKEYGLDCYSKDPADIRKMRRLLDSNEYAYLRTDRSLKLVTK